MWTDLTAPVQTKAHRNYLKESCENIFNIPAMMHSLGNPLNKPIKVDATASVAQLHYARNKTAAKKNKWKDKNK